MISFIELDMAVKTPLLTVLFLLCVTCVCTAILIGRKQGLPRLCLLTAESASLFFMLILYASVIPAERAKPDIPKISLWFSGQSLLIPLLICALISASILHCINREIKRRKSEISVSSIKESLDHLATGLCFSYPNGLVLMTNHKMNELCHTLFEKSLQNANLFWQALESDAPASGCERLPDSGMPVFRLPDASVYSFTRENLDGIRQISAANITKQHQLVEDLKVQSLELEKMNGRIRDYGRKVDRYVSARERLETRVSLHRSLGQALLMTRSHLLEHTGDRAQIVSLLKRNISVLRMEAEPLPDTDSFMSLKNAAEAVGMRVKMNGPIPESLPVQKLLAAAGAEALTNAVRHAGAKCLTIEFETSDRFYTARYTNDGLPPSGPVTEGGGLGSLRRKTEAAGGLMTVSHSPEFILTLSFGKEVTQGV